MQRCVHALDDRSNINLQRKARELQIVPAKRAPHAGYTCELGLLLHPEEFTNKQSFFREMQTFFEDQKLDRLVGGHATV
jgi:hypothetical protein